MKYALSLPIGGACSDPRLLAELAGLAEQAGWDGVFLEDYIVYQGQSGMPTCDPWIALAAMALATRRVRLGTLVTPLSRRRPWKLARETATLDQLSGGRMVLGAGLGDAADTSFTHFGEETDPRQKGLMLDEGLELLALLWSGEPFRFHGRCYQAEGEGLLPRPVQQPRIPIWIGGGWPHRGPVRRAARWDGACLYRVPQDGQVEQMTPDDVRALKAAILAERENGAPLDIIVGGGGRPKDWQKEREHIQAVGEAGATWWAEWVPPASAGEMRAIAARPPLWAD